MLCPRSGHCKQLAPKWRKLAEALHGVVKVAAVNCEQQQVRGLIWQCTSRLMCNAAPAGCAGISLLGAAPVASSKFQACEQLTEH